MAGLQDYLNSDYIQRLKLFAKDRTRDYVSVYVEGEDDVDFWTYAFNQLGNQTKFQFVVTTNKKAVWGGGTTDGKAELLKMGNLGPNKIVCVDADFDLLIDDYSAYTQKIRENAYVVHTTYYSIENILSGWEFYASLSQSLKIKESMVVYQEQLKWISLTCRDIFLLLLSYSKKDEKSRLFGFDDFSNCLNGIYTNDIGDFSKSQSYRAKWNQQYASLFDARNVEISTIHADLNNAGYADEQFYALMRGHDLYNSLIKPWIEKIIKQTINEKIRVFKESHQGTEIREYKDNLFKEFGTHKGLKEVIDFHFYHNKPVPLTLPNQTVIKISALFS